MKHRREDEPATMAMPDRIRIALSDGPSPGLAEVSSFDLGSKRFWPAALVVGTFFLIFAWVAVTQVDWIGGSGIESVFELMFVLFGVFWVLGWSVGVVVLFLITVFLLFYDESARLTPTRFIHVPRLGPVRVFMEYDLTRMDDLRLASGNAPDEATIRFDYGDRSVNLGNGVPRDEARTIVSTLQEAIENATRKGKGAGESVAPSRSSGDEWIAPGFDVTDWLRRKVEKRRPDEGELAEGEVEEDEVGSRKDAAARIDAAPAPSWTSPSVLALLVANLVPLVGVLSLGWDLGHVMVLFWAESGVIGFYGILRLVYVSGWSAIFLGPFFLGHFGGFMAGHFLFIYYLFVQGMDAAGTEPGALEALGDLFVPLWPALLALFFSHGVSFFTNFLRKREFVGRDPSDQMSEPYKRIMVMHISIIVGGFIIMTLGQPVGALILLVVLKAAVDLRAHRKEHAGEGSERVLATAAAE